jgi:hypothetical protein
MAVSLEKAHNGQSKVNAVGLLAGKSGFFRPLTPNVPETLCFRDAALVCNEDERA